MQLIARFCFLSVLFLASRAAPMNEDKLAERKFTTTGTHFAEDDSAQSAIETPTLFIVEPSVVESGSTDLASIASSLKHLQLTSSVSNPLQTTFTSGKPEVTPPTAGVTTDTFTALALPSTAAGHFYSSSPVASPAALPPVQADDRAPTGTGKSIWGGCVIC
ncbi:hypothetical protein C8R45DRAFT_564004 [Mycena sanguinolenta]|nr:hypothetical protein C8R45DRAFT_564004 [Mycena sanguinolenta]